MLIRATAIVIDQAGDVLLLAGERAVSLEPPSDLVRAGELPTKTIERVVRELTGLYVMPVRLAGLFHLHGEVEELNFCFRCIMRGGQIAIGEGAQPAGFFTPGQLPLPLSSVFRRLMERSLYHESASATMDTIYPSLTSRLKAILPRRPDARTALEDGAGLRPSPNAAPAGQGSGRPQVLSQDPGGGANPSGSTPGPESTDALGPLLSTVVIVETPQGETLWMLDSANSGLHLPSTQVLPAESPWDSARRLLETIPGMASFPVELQGAYFARDASEAILVFRSGQSRPADSALSAGARFLPPSALFEISSAAPQAFVTPPQRVAELNRRFVRDLFTRRDDPIVAWMDMT
jgi:hypothetical protein